MYLKNRKALVVKARVWWLEIIPKLLIIEVTIEIVFILVIVINKKVAKIKAIFF